jgi:hypothetical protein
MPRGGRPEKSQVSVRCSGAGRWRQSLLAIRGRARQRCASPIGWPEIVEKKVPQTIGPRWRRTPLTTRHIDAAAVPDQIARLLIYLDHLPSCRFGGGWPCRRCYLGVLKACAGRMPVKPKLFGHPMRA